MTSTLHGVIAAQPRGAVAILGPEMSYGQVLDRIDAGASWRLDPRDRVAIVLPDGPDLILALLTVCARAVAVPINPALRDGEIAEYLDLVRATAMIDASGFRRLDRPVPELLPGVAVIFPTSGTQGHPKRVPLTHGNICGGSRNVVTALGLTPSDRCLNVAPLYNAHGIIGATMSTFTAGGSIAARPFHAAEFFRRAEEVRPTWWSAAPAIHREILDQAAGRTIPSLRFLRSMAASMPPTLRADIERTLKVPVFEAYGMTEAAQITTNRPTPHPRKPGSVGVAVGTQISIIDGEVAVKGPNVMAGYLDDPEANRAIFRDGWMLTGDLGRIDPDGFLFLTGRAKEMINRGGQKVAPRDVEEALLAHPSIADAGAFALPHERLGEDLAAGVVLKPGSAARADELRAFVSERLADYKVPRRIVFLDAIPRNAAGKVERTRMVIDIPARVEPATPTERKLAAILGDVLGVPPLGRTDDFFQAGGDSLRAAVAVGRIEVEFKVVIPYLEFFTQATVGALAAVIERGSPAVRTYLVPIRETGTRPPFFCVHAKDGTVLPYIELARELGDDQPLYGIQAAGIDGATDPHGRIEEMAAAYVREVRAVRPSGPWWLGGWSLGGVIAVEMARLLGNAKVVLIEPAEPDTRVTPNRLWRDEANLVLRYGRRLTRYLDRPASALPIRVIERIADGMALLTSPRRRIIRRVSRMQGMAHRAYRASRYDGPILLIHATSEPRLPDSDLEGWKRLLGNATVEALDGSHTTLLTPPAVEMVAARIRRFLG